MTVEELIKELEKFPKDLPVMDFSHEFFTEVEYDVKYDQDDKEIKAVKVW